MSFDPALPTDRDWVRLLIGDDDPADEQLQDSTIDAIITEVLAHGASAQGAKYCAAAQAGALLSASWISDTRGRAEKAVSKLRIQYAAGSQGSAMEQYTAYLKSLQEKCTHQSLSTPALLKAW